MSESRYKIQNCSGCNGSGLVSCTCQYSLSMKSFCSYCTWGKVECSKCGKTGLCVWDWEKNRALGPQEIEILKRNLGK